MDKLAKRYSTRPSEFIELDDTYAAYCLDEAVLTFALGVENKLEAVPTPKGKNGHERRAKAQLQLLHRILGIEETEEQKTKKFRDPMERFRR